MRSGVDLSVVLPVHNEAEALRALHAEIRETLDPLPLRYEVLYVDDGSDDESPRVLASLHAADPRVRVVRLRRNYGQTAALDAGFRLARGRTIASLDADGENDPRDIPRLLARLEEGYDVVCGWRRDRRDALLSRRLPSRIANAILGLWSGSPVHDSGCTLRACRRDAIRAMSLYAEMHRLLPAMARLHGAQIAEVPVAHRPRRGGRSHYGLSRAWKVLADLAVLRLLSGLSRSPTRAFATAAAFPLVLGLAALAEALREAAGRGGPAGSGVAGPGTLPVVAGSCAALLLFLAGYLMLLGILGEALLEGHDPRRGSAGADRLSGDAGPPARREEPV